MAQCIKTYTLIWVVCIMLYGIKYSYVILMICKIFNTSSTKAHLSIDSMKLRVMSFYFVLSLFLFFFSDLTDKMKRNFFQAVVRSILLYGCTTWTLTKRLEKKLDGNYTRMFRAILNKSWRQYPTRHQLYGHLPPITKTIRVRRTWRTLREKQGRAHKRCTPMDPCIWPSKSWTTSSSIHTAAMWRYGMSPWRPARGDER